jgi:hypothetical protein
MKNESGGSLKEGVSFKQSIDQKTTRGEGQGQRPKCDGKKVGKFTIK